MTNAPENLAKALEAMTHRVAELEAELAANCQLLNTYKAMLFGSRSEKARIVLDEQGCLDLGVAGRLMKALRRQLDLRNVALTSSACQEVVS